MCGMCTEGVSESVGASSNILAVMEVGGGGGGSL